MKCDTCKMKRACAELERMRKVQRHENCRCYIQVKPVTNYDRIVRKSPEEMAEFFTQHYYDGPKFYCPVQQVIGEGECAMRSDCRQCLLDWLKQEAKE